MDLTFTIRAFPSYLIILIRRLFTVFNKYKEGKSRERIYTIKNIKHITRNIEIYSMKLHVCDYSEIPPVYNCIILIQKIC